MKAVIVEDEKAAVRNLTALLEQVDPQIEIIATLDSITDSIEWLGSHPRPDLIFMDINLADGSAFDIFDNVTVNSPVIFTTAYDEYALRAFKVNSIDYLLKPIGEQEVRHALNKLENLRDDHNSNKSESKVETDNMKNLIELLGKRRYTTHFLVPQRGDKFMPLTVGSISYFYIQDGAVRAVTTTGAQYTMPQTLDELTESVDPDNFFRINRQYLISRDAVHDLDLWFNNRLSVNLKIATAEKILVSKIRVSDFKAWFACKMH